MDKSHISQGKESRRRIETPIKDWDDDDDSQEQEEKEELRY